MPLKKKNRNYFKGHTMTQSNDMPKEIYVFQDPQSIGDRGFTVTKPEKTCSGKQFTPYVRKDLPPPQSLNRAVLDALIKVRDRFFPVDQHEASKDLLWPVVNEAIAAANQADEVKVIDGLEEAISSFSHAVECNNTDPDSSDSQEAIELIFDCVVDKMMFTPVEVVLHAAQEHLKRQKGRY